MHPEVQNNLVIASIYLLFSYLVHPELLGKPLDNDGLFSVASSVFGLCV